MRHFGQISTLNHVAPGVTEGAHGRRSTRVTLTLLIIITVVLVALTGSCKRDEPPVLPSEAPGFAAFEDRVKEFVALHEKIEATLPALPAQATPQQIDERQRALADGIKSARRDAKQGEFFTPGMEALIKRVMTEVLAGPDGDTIKASIMDENPGVPEILVNERYPSSVPLSTMPAQVLERLPPLKEKMEYRFIGRRMVLMDTEADLILDFTGEVLTR